MREGVGCIARGRVSTTESRRKRNLPITFALSLSARRKAKLPDVGRECEYGVFVCALYIYIGDGKIGREYGSKNEGVNKRAHQRRPVCVSARVGMGYMCICVHVCDGGTQAWKKDLALMLIYIYKREKFKVVINFLIN